MLDLMPKKFIKLKNLNNWNKYSKLLKKFTLVEKYLGDAFEIWVNNTDNPLSISLISDLFKNELDYFNKNLINMEKSIGETNLFGLLNELKIQGKNPVGIINKTHSLYGEIFAYSELIKKYSTVVKIEEFGDWECDNNTIISVKTKNVLDHNYEIFENILRSLYFIRENNVLRKYNQIDIEENKNIDDKFINNVLRFLNSSLIEFINFHDRQINCWDNLKQENTKYLLDNGKYQGWLNSEVESFKDDNKGNIISLCLTEDRSGEKEESKHQIKFVFKENSDKTTLSISLDTNVWWGKPKIRWLDLKDSIDSYLAKFDKCYKYFIGQNKNFIGWININLHLKHENYSLETEKIKKDIKTLIGKKDYSIIIALVPKWNSTKPNIIEI